MLYIGNHTTSSKGYENMAKQMIKNGGNTFAFFTRNPRGGNAKDVYKRQALTVASTVLFSTSSSVPVSYTHLEPSCRYLW